MLSAISYSPQIIYWWRHHFYKNPFFFFLLPLSIFSPYQNYHGSKPTTIESWGEVSVHKNFRPQRAVLKPICQKYKLNKLQNFSFCYYHCSKTSSCKAIVRLLIMKGSWKWYSLMGILLLHVCLLFLRGVGNTSFFILCFFRFTRPLAWNSKHVVRTG